MSALLSGGETAATERNKDLGQSHDGRHFFFPCYGPSLPGGPGCGFCLLRSRGEFPPSVVHIREKGSESCDSPKQHVLTKVQGEEAAGKPQGVSEQREGGRRWETDALSVSCRASVG